MKRLDISDQTAVSMPMKNLIAIVIAVAVGVWAYFGVIERLNNLETKTDFFSPAAGLRLHVTA